MSVFCDRLRDVVLGLPRRRLSWGFLFNEAVEKWTDDEGQNHTAAEDHHLFLENKEKECRDRKGDGVRWSHPKWKYSNSRNANVQLYIGSRYTCTAMEVTVSGLGIPTVTRSQVAWFDRKSMAECIFIFNNCIYVWKENQEELKRTETSFSFIRAGDTHPASLLLEFGCFLGVGHRPLDKAHWLVHVALNPVNHAPLEVGGTRW